jgi:hypothetical protein
MGVAFATLLTLVMIPSLFAVINDVRLLVHRVRRGTWPGRNDVEPAGLRRLEPGTVDSPGAGTRMEMQLNRQPAEETS